MKTELLKKTSLVLAAVCLLSACNDNEESNFTGKDNYILSFELVQDEASFTGAITDDEVIITIPGKLILENAVATYRISEHAAISPDPSEITGWDEEQEFTITAYNGATRTYTYKVERSTVLHSGNVILTTQADVAAFTATGASLIDGHLIIGSETGGENEDAVTDLSALAGIKEVTYNIVINPGYAGTDLKGLENIEKAGTITIGQVANLERVELPNLEFVNNDLSIRDASTIEIFNLNRLQRIGGSLTLANLSLTTLSLPLLESVSGTLSLTLNIEELNTPLLQQANSLYLSLEGLEKISFGLLEQCKEMDLRLNKKNTPAYIEFPVLKETSDITITGASNGNIIEEINFPQLVKITGKLSYVSGYNISAITGFTALETVNQLSLNLIRLVERINFPALKTIEDSFTISGNSRYSNILTHLDGLSAVESVKNVSISYCSALSSFYGLRNCIDQVQSWTVNSSLYNVTLEQMLAGEYYYEP
ncbi:MAG: DUF5018 domain-containing protein [Bacteroides sp.]|nr:DUF5018 domain-containing protein [Bacteroides sp.]